MDVIVNGTGLQGAGAVRVSGEGVAGQVLKVENPNLLRITVTIDPDATVGERDLRVMTPAGGVSNRFRFFVGELPEINEKEPNSLKSQAQRLETLPIVVNGQVHPSDTDFFRFAAKAGQTLVCHVQARELLPYIADAVPGWLETCLTLYDADGKELAYAGRFRFNPDPLLIYQRSQGRRIPDRSQGPLLSRQRGFRLQTQRRRLPVHYGHFPTRRAASFGRSRRVVRRQLAHEEHEARAAGQQLSLAPGELGPKRAELQRPPICRRRPSGNAGH